AADAGGKHAGGGAEAELHRSQRAAVIGSDGQRGAEFVARVGVVGTDVAIAFGGVPVEVEHAPVVHDQDETASPPRQFRADGVLGGLAGGMEPDVGVVRGAGHGARRRERLGSARQGGQSCYSGADRVRMLAHKLPKPNLVAAIQAAEMESIPTEATKSQNCVHTYALGGEGRGEGDATPETLRGEVPGAGAAPPETPRWREPQ